MSRWFLLALLLVPNVAMAQRQSFPDMCPGTSPELQRQLSRLASPDWAGKPVCYWPEGVLRGVKNLAQKEGCSCSKKRA